MHNRISGLKTVYFDNNFFNPQLAQFDQQKLVRSFISARLQWCFSEELLLELFGSIQKLNALPEFMMTQWASVCSALWSDSKVFRNYARIILAELHRKNMNIFYKRKEVGRIKEIFNELSSGKTPPDISSAWSKRGELKNDDEEFCLGLKNLRQKGARELSLEQFSTLFLRNTLFIDSPQDVDQRVKAILSDLSEYPHLRTYLFVAHKLSYVRTGKRHLFDQRHLVYATDMDYFVSDDDRMSNLANQIFLGRPNVLTQRKFFELIGA